MPTKKEMLAKTNDGVSEVEKRVFYTLTEVEKQTAHRTAKAVGLLFSRLHAAGVLKKKDVDDILFECIS